MSEFMEMYSKTDERLFFEDFKDKLTYRKFKKDIQQYNNLQKWIIYDVYSSCDADVVLKKK